MAGVHLLLFCQPHSNAEHDAKRYCGLLKVQVALRSLGCFRNIEEGGLIF